MSIPLTPSEKIALEIMKLTTDVNEQKKLIESYYSFVNEDQHEFTLEAKLELIKLFKPLSQEDRNLAAANFKALLDHANQVYDKSF